MQQKSSAAFRQESNPTGQKQSFENIDRDHNFIYDPTISNINLVNKVQLSPSGLQHLHWGTWDETYIGSMLQVTPIADEELHQKLSALVDDPSYDKWRTSVVLFLEYLVKEDGLYSNNIEHQAYVGQQKLLKALKKKREAMHLHERGDSQQ